jgi:putative membrane protein
MMYGDDGGWGWMMVVGPLLWIALIAAAVWVVVTVIRRATGPTVDPTPRESPQEILDRRFASGEIDADTYAKVRSALMEGRPSDR